MSGRHGVPVHVFKGRIGPFAGQAKEHRAYVVTVTTDEMGRYRAALPPGQYSVVAEIGDKLYTSPFGSPGDKARVTVVKNRWTSHFIAVWPTGAFRRTMSSRL